MVKTTSKETESIRFPEDVTNHNDMIHKKIKIPINP